MEHNLERLINEISFKLVIMKNDKFDRSVLDEMTDKNKWEKNQNVQNEVCECKCVYEDANVKKNERMDMSELANPTGPNLARGDCSEVLHQMCSLTQF